MLDMLLHVPFQKLAREDEKVDAMEIDGQHQQVATTAVPDGFNAYYLRIYYGKLFPHGDFFRGFHMEMNDIYLRFQPLDSVAEMESSIKEKCPFKIDIGPPAKRHAYVQSGNNVFVPDISDYDDVRYCCSGADVCIDCWPLMTIAIKVLDASLRGMLLKNEQRAAIADYFRVYKVISYYLVNNSLHPPKKKLFASEERYQKILDLISDESKNMLLVSSMTSGKETDDSTRWEQLKSTLQSGKHKGLRRCIEEIVFSYTYPRLDMEVSKHMNHLLKAPFCIHPKTGRGCVPIDSDNCDDFYPMTAPTLSQLLGELNAADWEGTSLEKSIRFFRTSFLQPLLKACRVCSISF
uniref:DNA primase n=1 Tax=Oryza punctata TaxID=4537 RepID=A0A0E0L1H3_ORYPU